MISLASPTPDKTILIVEDEIVLQDVYKLILQTRGYNIVTACNGVEGLKRTEKYNPDLVILDNFMPVMSGVEYLRNLDISKHPGMKIIGYSNLSDKQVETEMRELGADVFVLKSSMAPLDLIELVDGLLVES